MNTDWMGRYRPLVAALIRHSNVNQRFFSERIPVTTFHIELSAQEWQMLEYLLEHPDHRDNMAVISDALGIAHSTLTKYAKSLVKHGLAERLRRPNDRKSVILRATEKGRQVYDVHSVGFVRHTFTRMFGELESLTDEQLSVFTTAIDMLTNTMLYGDGGDALVRMDE